MLGTTRDELIETLTALRRSVCDYDAGIAHKEPIICDCKYGFELKPRGSYHGEQNGCPELRDVVYLLEELTEGEFELIGERIIARIRRRAVDLKEIREHERSKQRERSA